MKKKLELEYTFNSSPKVLYSRLSTPSGLSEWFAENVNQNGNMFAFMWDGSVNEAEEISRKENKHIRFRWLDEEDPNAYFEFKIDVHELTSDVALIITDFVEEDEEEESTTLWDSQIMELKRIIGL